MTERWMLDVTTCILQAKKKATSDGYFQGDNPLDFALPLLILQIVLVVVVTRFISFLLKPFRQPRVIAEIIGGVILGPSLIGRSAAYMNIIFPDSSMIILDTIANIGLMFFLFLVGLELDLRALRNTGKKAILIALVGISVPFVLGVGVSELLRKTISKGTSAAPLIVFIGVSLSITAFPVLARILAELKLLTTDVGRMAMSAAAINDIVAWILLALAVALTGSGSPLISLWVLLCGFGFVVFAAVIVRPFIVWLAFKSPDGEQVKEIHICITLLIVLVGGFITDVIGIHALFGAFIIGIIIPKEGPFARVLIEKIEDLISSIFLPLYFVSSGLKTNVATISGPVSWALLLLVIVTACFGKIVGTIFISMILGISSNEAVALGFLMNTKGLVEIIVLNIGKDRGVLNEESFAILVIMALFTTFVTTPVVTAVYKPGWRTAPYKYRTIQGTDLKSELRVVACYHTMREMPGMINLIESSRGTCRRGMTMYVMHLMELSERPSDISIVNKARRNGLPFWNNRRSEGNNAVVAFEAFGKLSHVKIRSMTVISDLLDIHEDIITSSQQKRAAFIILPFHKYQRFDGDMESLGNSYGHVNHKVLRHATCSVGIFIDRGFGGSSQVSASEVSFNAAVVFIGGKDDREALSFGSRIAEHPGIGVSVLCFRRYNDEPNISIEVDNEEQIADELTIAEFKTNIVASNPSINYEEKRIGTKEEVIAELKSLGKFNIILVGRSPPIEQLDDRSDCNELGPIGSYMASLQFSTTSSVLVIQQYCSKANEKLSFRDTNVYDIIDSSPSDEVVIDVPPLPSNEVVPVVVESNSETITTDLDKKVGITNGIC
ncbi:Cation/H(+) antiporter [Zostera marina]|uniref:Cation/H(+) antiporter n=1 Tax=Zostera marina TaxID=29655 RepID=A0A0K9NMD6_ZOSMR|nr:Cation/H(+) antiporter [Zostera marina]